MDFGSILKQIGQAGMNGIRSLFSPQENKQKELEAIAPYIGQNPVPQQALQDIRPGLTHLDTGRRLPPSPPMSFFDKMKNDLRTMLYNGETLSPVPMPKDPSIPTPTPAPTPTRFSVPTPQVLGQTVQAPTPTAMPTGIPEGVQRLEPYPTGPGTPDRNELYPKLRTQEAVIQPAVFDSIMKYITDDYQRRLAMSLAYQESTGGLSPVGDDGKSFGPYHIMPGNSPWSEFGSSSNISEGQARDPEYATQFLKGVMDNQLAAGKQPSEQVLRWNANSGYQKDKGLVDDNGVPYTQNLGPRYDEDIPRFATMAAFLRGR